LHPLAHRGAERKAGDQGVRDLIDQGRNLHRAGHLAQAEALYRQVLRQQPGHADALHLMGVMALQTGRFADAVDWIGRAIAGRPDFPEAHNNLGNALKALGRPQDAIGSYDHALALRPDFPEAHNNRGVCLQGLGRLDEAAAAFGRALASRPDYPEAAIGRAVTLERLGRLGEAADGYRAAALLLPDNADLRNTLGNTLHALGRPDEAAAAYGEAVRLRPDFAEFHINRGVALTECRRLDEAAAALRTALALAPGHVRAMTALGTAWQMDGKVDEAVACLGDAVRAAPDFAPAHGNLGLALARLGRLDEALDCQRTALRLQPDNVMTHNNLAVVLTEMGRYDQALASVETALRLRPDFPEAHMTKGNTLKALGRLEEAAASLEAALGLKPGSAEAHTALGSVYQALWRLDDALAEHRRALLLWPDYPAALMNLGMTLQIQGLPAEAAVCYERIIVLRPDHDTAFGNLLNCTMYRDDLDHDAVAEIHRRFGRAFTRPPLPGIAPEPVAPEPAAAERRLRIGYLSSDLRNHPVAGNLFPVIRHHDRAAFSVHFYSHLANPDDHTREFQALADGWRDIRTLSDRQAAELIRADRIDILVCLAGRFDLNRPVICAYRAAPIQISMHDVGTSGLAEMDYILGDGRLLARPSREYFAERRLRLPSFVVADFPPALPPLPAQPRQGPVVFGCFNNPAKISPGLVRLWASILAALPQSRLTLKYQGAYGSPTLRDRLRGQLVAGGAMEDQVTFVADQDSYAAFIARYDQVDIALDTTPFSGSTTSFQALAMGVPVVTLAGERMVGRWTASMLRTLRLPQLIAPRPEDYIAIALNTAAAIDLWRGRRAEIRDRVAASPLCDGTSYTRRLERLYRAVWRKARYSG